ncbi:MAG TPA: phosphoribosylamine--glycine ligase [Candidatus Methylacidiphilales bacterium]|nr:phosphoribosylamine--glycine ligase [Candidatus Methylacidiphilales bacterium]
MKILLVGSGGREHALAWRLCQDGPKTQLFTAPGNAGTARLGVNLPMGATDLDALTAWAAKEKPGLTIVGPEAPLCAGITDRFEKAGLPIFGPNAAAARLEGSKVFTKNLLLKHHLPTAPGAGFSDPLAAYAYSRDHPAYPQVIKADGLAAGKGVIIAPSPREAALAIHQIMELRVFGEAGRELVIEEFLAGREMSVHVLTDGRAHVILPIAQDHKRLGDGDTGLNTGGMGAYAPAPFATAELQEQISREIVEPVLAAFQKEGLDFRGILYIGLIWTKQGPRILEFNVRGGDPETQVLLPLLDTPLLELLEAVREQRLGKLKVKFNQNHAVTVVLAAAGYPGTPETGVPIEGLDCDLPGAIVFHAGTKLEGKKVVSSGGRVLSVTAWAPTLAAARDLAYQRAAKIGFPGSHYRRDIAARLTLEWEASL